MHEEDGLNLKQAEPVKNDRGTIAAIILFQLVVIGIIVAIVLCSGWPTRFHNDFDKFFGENAWECVDEETKDSMMYSVIVHTNSAYSEEVSGKFKNWYIEANVNGEKALFKITNHALKINHDRYAFFQLGKRLTAKQAVTMELMDISHQLIAIEVWEDIICDVFTEEQAALIDIEVMYRGGNPEPGFYDKLCQEEWFTVNATAEDYLETDLYDFYLLVRLNSTQLEKLSEEEQEAIMSRYDEMINAFSERFGEDVDLEILFGDIRKQSFPHACGGEPKDVLVDEDGEVSPLVWGQAAALKNNFFETTQVRQKSCGQQLLKVLIL